MDTAIVVMVPLLGAGALATLLLARNWSARLMEAAQQHGRFAGLEGSPAPAHSGSSGGPPIRSGSPWAALPAAS